MKLDNYDRTLLAALQGDGRVPQSELGQRAHLSTAAVNRRLKLLEGAGVIEKFSAQLNPRALGYDLTVIVEVKAENERAHLLEGARGVLPPPWPISQIHSCIPLPPLPTSKGIILPAPPPKAMHSPSN